ncbi:hypothetical protein PTNB29_01030 [Pyrenophora teres f. teres]|nr:hypothetical protein PTNB29_01030 [Pyrenophora teres f. teres]
MSSNKITYSKKKSQASSKPPPPTTSKTQVTASSSGSASDNNTDSNEDEGEEDSDDDASSTPQKPVSKRLKTNPPSEPLAPTASSSKKPVTKNFAKSTSSRSDGGQAADALDRVTQEVKQFGGNLEELRMQVAGFSGQNHVLAQQLHALQTQSAEDAEVAKLATEVAERTAQMAAEKASEKLRIQESENQRLREQLVESNTSRQYENSIKQTQEAEIVELKSTIVDMQKAEKAREQEANRDYKAKVDEMNILQKAHAQEAKQHVDMARKHAEEIAGLRIRLTEIDLHKQTADAAKKYADMLKDTVQGQTDHVATQKVIVKKLEEEILAKDQKVEECMAVEARLTSELQKEREDAMEDVLLHLNAYQGGNTSDQHMQLPLMD